MAELTPTQHAQHAAKLLNELAQRMNTIAEYMEVNNLNLENYPQNWNSFDDMGGMLNDVFVFSETDDKVQVMVGDS